MNQIRRFRVLEQLFGLPAVDVEDQSETAGRSPMARNWPRHKGQDLQHATFVGEAPNSTAAHRNLGILFPGGEASGRPVKIEIVDLLREPLRGLADGVLSPTLTGLAPPPVRRIVGNLSNHGVMLLALGAVP